MALTWMGVRSVLMKPNLVEVKVGLAVVEEEAAVAEAVAAGVDITTEATVVVAAGKDSVMFLPVSYQTRPMDAFLTIKLLSF